MNFFFYDDLTAVVAAADAAVAIKFHYIDFVICVDLAMAAFPSVFYRLLSEQKQNTDSDMKEKEEKKNYFN